MHQIRFWLGFRPDPAGGAYTTPPDPLAGSRGQGGREGEGRMEGDGKGKEVEGGGKGKGRGGKTGGNGSTI